ncbi:g7271 [Coccomyxa viridis]|uniref:G7271 protein n=1 Tax=Coccomyxa viridis TaxID=1274662 RepID=A0ABP1FXF7_9CHLO
MGTLQRQTTLSKQASAMFQMTLDQYQQSMGSGKPFGSLNMEDFISTVWDNNNLPPPQPSDATYNQPESLPTMQPQSSVAMHPDFGGKTVEEVWNAIHTAEKRNAERNGASTPPLDQQQTVGSFLQSIGALDFGDSGIPSLPSSFLPPAPELQVPPYFPSDASVHITQGNSLMGIEKAKAPGISGRNTHFEQASAAPQHYAQPELMHPQHQEDQHPPNGGHSGHPPLPPGAARRTYRGRHVDLAQDPSPPPILEGRAWPSQRPQSPAMPQTPNSSPPDQGAYPPVVHSSQDYLPASSAPDEAKRGEAGAAPALGMPALPAEQNKSPGAAARAARQRKRKAANMPEEFDERTMRMHKRMVKNRESAARSRARKQQYTAELEVQVEELKATNKMLLEKVIAQVQPAPAKHAPCLDGQPLRRTRTTPM